MSGIPPVLFRKSFVFNVGAGYDRRRAPETEWIWDYFIWSLGAGTACACQFGIFPALSGKISASDLSSISGIKSSVMRLNTICKLSVFHLLMEFGLNNRKPYI